MHNLGKQNVKLFYLYLLLCMIGVIMSLLALFSERNNRGNLKKDDYSFLSTGWTYEDDTQKDVKCNLPCKMKTKSSVFSIKRILKKEENVGKCLVVRTENQLLSVYVDGREIYCFDNNRNTLFTKTPGSVWNFIDIQESYYGKEIKLVYTSVYKDDRGQIGKIYIGSKKDIFIVLIDKHKSGIIISLLMMGLSGILFLLWLWVKNEDEVNKLLFLSMFAMVLSLWSILETQVLQFMVKNQEILSVISKEALMLLILPILFCIRENMARVGKVLVALAMTVSIGAFFLCNILQFMHIADLEETVKITHISTAIALLLVVFFGTGKVFIGEEGNKKLNWSKVGYVLLSLSIFMDVANYYFRFYEDGATCSRVGIFFFILILGASIMGNIYSMIIDTDQIEKWDSFAYYDVLTKAYNRASYEEELQDIVNNQTEEDKIAIISCDVNNLKTINDTYGHSAGDSYLIDCVRVISSIIKDKAKLYRTGGDEFVVIIRPYERGQVNDYVKSFENILRNKDESLQFPISFAYGYSYFKPKVDHDIYETVKRADKDMYEKKVEMKRNGADVRL